MRCNHHLYDMGMHGWDETGPQLCVVCEKLWWPSVLYWDGTEAQWPALTRSYNKGSTTNECEHCPQPPEEALAGRTPWGRVCSRCDHAKTFLHFSKWDLSNDESEEFTRAESYGLLDPVCGPRLDKFGYEYGTFTLSLYCKECEEKLGIFEMRKTCHECESSQPMWRFLEEPYPRWEPCVTDLPLRETCAGCVNNAKIITKKIRYV